MEKGKVFAFIGACWHEEAVGSITKDETSQMREKTQSDFLQV